LPDIVDRVGIWHSFHSGTGNPTGCANEL